MQSRLDPSYCLVLGYGMSVPVPTIQVIRFDNTEDNTCEVFPGIG